MRKSLAGLFALSLITGCGDLNNSPAQVEGYERGVCAADEFLCGGTECVPTEWICDGNEDCSGGQDEVRCDAGGPIDPRDPIGGGGGGAGQSDYPEEGEDRYGDTAAEATGIQVPSRLPGRLDIDDKDYVSFTAGVSEVHRIQTLGNLATACQLLDRAGRSLAQDAGSGEGDNCKLEQRLIAGGTYTVEILLDRGMGGTYDLDVSIIEGVQSECGNGRIEPGEACDDGNRRSGDGCSAACREETPAVCGNGEVEPREGCDDGNQVDGDGCDSNCQREEGGGGGGGLFGECGDGVVDLFEQCDDGNNVAGDGCDPACMEEEAVVPDDHSDLADEGTLVVLGEAVPGEIGMREDVDWFRFDAHRPGLWTIETTGALDTICRLYSVEGAELADNDDGGEGTNCRIEHEILAPGEHRVQVSSFMGRTGLYSLSVTAPAEGGGDPDPDPGVDPDPGEEPVEPEPGDDHGDEIGAARDLSPEGAAGELEQMGDLDVFRIDPDAAGEWTVRTTGNIDVTCRLMDADGVELEANDDGGLGLNCSISRVLAPGTTYYFEVAGFNNARTGAYAVELIAPGDDPNGDLHGDDRASAAALDAFGQEVVAAIDESGDIDYFSMTANAAGAWRIESSGNLDVVCSLEDAQGMELAVNDDGGVGTNCLLTHELEIGQQVFIKIRAFSNFATGSYAFTVTSP